MKNFTNFVSKKMEDKNEKINICNIVPRQCQSVYRLLYLIKLLAAI